MPINSRDPDDFEQAARDAWFDGGGAIDPGETYSHTFEVPV